MSLDLHEYLKGASIMSTTSYFIIKEQVPLTMKHEISGIIEEIDESVDDLRVGVRIVVDFLIYDNICIACKERYINCCENNDYIGLNDKVFRDFHERFLLKN